MNTATPAATSVVAATTIAMLLIQSPVAARVAPDDDDQVSGRRVCSQRPLIAAEIRSCSLCAGIRTAILGLSPGSSGAAWARRVA
ncbi:hypothetical protein [Streptomyces sp. 900105755]